MTPGIEAWCPACGRWSAHIYRCSRDDCGRDLTGIEVATRRTRGCPA